jgi:DNA modification methylase
MRVSEEVIIGDCRLILGDCLSVMRAMPENSVDSIVTDPPYGLTQNKKGGTGLASVNLNSPAGRSRIGVGNGGGGFMGHKWDSAVPSSELWAECLRVLKPGGHLLAFAGTRTQHRMATAIEDGGFEIRDMIAWVYGSGFPKSLDVSKAIDKAAGATREPTGNEPRRQTPRAMAPMGTGLRECDASTRYDDPATEAARHWQGWGTALKPALEPITMARKPLVSSVAANVLAHGTGAINVDACRVPLEEDCRLLKGGTYGGNRGSDKGTSMFGTNTKGLGYEVPSANGRWPANLIHDGSEEVVACFPESRSSATLRNRQPRADKTQYRVGGDYETVEYGDTGSAARFFYCAKASKADRDEGLDHMAKDVVRVTNTGHTGNPSARNGERTFNPRANNHPTVKPTALMRYLCRLVTPQSGTVLDPFMGSGSTGKAAVLEGFEFIGIEREAEYVAIAEARIVEAQRSLGLFA